MHIPKRYHGKSFVDNILQNRYLIGNILLVVVFLDYKEKEGKKEDIYLNAVVLNKMHDIWFARMKSNFEAFWGEMGKREWVDESKNGVSR